MSKVQPGIWIFLVAFTVFMLSPVRQVADSNYSMLVSQSLLEHGTVRLDDYLIPGFNSDLPAEPRPDYKPYQLQRKAGHSYLYYPPGSSVLSVPYVAAIKLIGVSPVDEHSKFDFFGEAKIECSLAALLMASLAAAFYFMARILLPMHLSVAIALAAAFGTQMWSTASRGLWAHTWGIWLTGFVAWILLDHEANRRPLRPMLLASLLAWAYFVRPTYCVPVAAVAVYVLATNPRRFVAFALTGAGWLGGLVLYSQYQFGQWLPDYFHNQLSFVSFWNGVAGTLISPSRGLLVCVPSLLFVGWLLVRYRKSLPCPRLVTLSLAIITIHLIVIAGFKDWYAGHCFGARYMTDLIPWFVLLAILGARAALDWRQTHPGASTLRARMELATAWLLVLLGIAINGNGALNAHTSRWNVEPVNVNQHPERVWDWRDPQFLAGLPR
jgi:hypothetical protein